MQFHAADITKEAADSHFAAYDDHWNLLGTLLMRPSGTDSMKMKQVAVAPHMRRQGIGRYMIHEVEKWCLRNQIRTIELSARQGAIAFYQALGYDTIGDPYTEIGIEHSKMSKKLISTAP